MMPSGSVFADTCLELSLITTHVLAQNRRVEGDAASIKKVIGCFTLRRKWRKKRAVCLPLVLGGFLTLSSPANATYSLLAVDTENEEFGGFAISCIGTELSLSEVVRLNGTNIIAAQGYFFEEGRDELALQLERGASPPEAMEAALDPNTDPPGVFSGRSYRQYAAIDLGGTVAQHSGTDLSEFAGHIEGTIGTLHYAIQGNFLTESAVLGRLEEGFHASEADIARRAISALQALTDAGGGDSRCSPRSGDAGYFTWSGPGSPRLEVEIVQPEEEIARALGAEIGERLAEAGDAASPPDGSGKSADSTRKASCTWTPAPGKRGAAFVWSLFASVALLVRLRAKKSCFLAAP